MIKTVEKIGRFSFHFAENIGRSGVFLFSVIFQKPKSGHCFRMLLSQLYCVGFLSLLIVLFSGVFIGMVLGLQGYTTLSKFGATAQLGQLVALSVTRELGPVVTALLFAGRAGSALTAEIGLMRATEQLSCMEMMAVDPLWRVVAPRFWAGFIALPLLTLIFNAVAVYGGHLTAVTWLGIDNGIFWSNMKAAVSFRLDVLNGIIKSIAFGFVVTWVAIYQGYFTQPNAAGIAKATTRTVVFSSLMILALDFILTSSMIGGW